MIDCENLNDSRAAARDQGFKLVDVVGARFEELRQLRLEIAKQGRSILDVSMINPDLPPPRYALDKLMEASAKPYNHCYAVSRGVRKLREGFSNKYNTAFGVHVNPDTEVCACMGTKEAIVSTLGCFGRHFPGEKVLLARPTYPTYRWAVELAGMQACYFSLCSDNQQMLAEIESILRSEKIRVIVLNFPTNPTGQIVDSDFYERLSQLLPRNETYLINDFVYGEMLFESKLETNAVSALRARNSETSSYLLETYSLSKAYSLPGWRIGAVMGAPQMIRELAQHKSHIDYGAFLPLQFASAALLNSKSDFVRALVSEYGQRCRSLSTGLRRLGWEFDMPQAGVSLWARIPLASRSLGSLEYARKLLTESAVAVMPGEIFGSEYREYIRFAVVVPQVGLHELVGRLEQMST